MLQRKQASGRCCLVIMSVERIGAARRTREQARVEQLDAAKNMRIRRADGTHRTAIFAETKIAATGMADGARRRTQQQQRIHARIVPGRSKTR